jgi:hypothetical protein
MREIELTVGQSVQVGSHILRVLAVYPDEVVFDLLGPDEDAEPASGHDCWHDRIPTAVHDKV